MKKFLFFFLITAVLVNAQDDKFEKALGKYVKMLDSLYAISFDDMIKAKNGVERIAEKETGKWQAQYYAAFFTLMPVFRDTVKSNIDPYLDMVDKYLDKADELSPKNSEVYVLKAFAATGRLMVNPMARWEKYGAIFSRNIELALEYNPDNPRAHALRALSVLNMPEAFGGGYEKAKPLMDTASEMFAKFVPAHKLDPDWGRDMLEEMKNRNKK